MAVATGGPLYRAGKLRLLAWPRPSSPEFPDVPTVAESGALRTLP